MTRTTLFLTIALLTAPLLKATERAETPTPEAIGTAVVRACRYFNQNQDKIRNKQIAVALLLLDEHFGTPLEISGLAFWEQKFPDIRQYQIMLYGHFLGCVDTIISREWFSQRLLDSTIGPLTIDQLNAWAMFCHQHPINERFFRELDHGIFEGGYRLTHTALQLQSVRINDCPCNDKTMHRYKKIIREELVGLIKNHELAQSNDLVFEAIMLLMYLEEDPYVKDEWIAYIIARQNQDGSWGSGTSCGTGMHTTLLGLWALLESAENY